KTALANPLFDHVTDRENFVGVVRVLPIQCVRIYFQWDGVVGSAVEKSAHVEFSEAVDSQLVVLLNVNQLVKEQSGVERLMRHDDVRVGDRRHAAERGEI